MSSIFHWKKKGPSMRQPKTPYMTSVALPAGDFQQQVPSPPITPPTEKIQKRSSSFMSRRRTSEVPVSQHQQSHQQQSHYEQSHYVQPHQSQYPQQHPPPPPQHHRPPYTHAMTMPIPAQQTVYDHHYQHQHPVEAQRVAHSRGRTMSLTHPSEIHAPQPVWGYPGHTHPAHGQGPYVHGGQSHYGDYPQPHPDYAGVTAPVVPPVVPVPSHPSHPASVSHHPAHSHLDPETQARRAREKAEAVAAMTKKIASSDYDNPDETRAREVAKRRGMRVTRDISKAWTDEFDAQQAKKYGDPTGRRPSTSRPRAGSSSTPVPYDDWAAVPVDDHPMKRTTQNPNAPLKSALKKTPSMGGPTPPQPAPVIPPPLSKQPAADRGGGGGGAPPGGGKKEARPASKTKPIGVGTVVTMADGAKLFRTKQNGPLQMLHPKWPNAMFTQVVAKDKHDDSPPPAVHDIRPAMQHAQSSSTASPTESIHGERDTAPQRTRSRHNSMVDSRPPGIPPPSNYVTPHIKPMDIAMSSPHGILAWPLVDFQKRKGDGNAYIYFDPAWHPFTSSKKQLKARRHLHYTDLTQEELNMPMVVGAVARQVTIKIRTLPQWPIYINMPVNAPPVRVCDVFLQIHLTLAESLSQHDLMMLGDKHVEACQKYFQRRCEQSPDFTHIEERRGMRRVDLLKGRRLFKTLTPMPGSPFTYELVFDDKVEL